MLGFNSLFCSWENEGKENFKILSFYIIFVSYLFCLNLTFYLFKKFEEDEWFYVRKGWGCYSLFGYWENEGKENLCL